MIHQEWAPEDYIALLRRHWLLIVVLGVSGTLLAYGASRLLPNRYTSRALVLIEQPTVPTDFVRPVVSSGVNERLATMQQQILSRARLEPIIQQLDLFPGESAKVPAGVLVAQVQAAITVSPIQQGTDDQSHLPGFYVNVTWNSPQGAQALCAVVTSMFVEENLKDREQNSEDTTQFLSQQLTQAKAKLDEQDAKLAAFQSHYLGSLPEEVPTNLNLLSGLHSEFDAATQALTRAQQDKSTAEANLTQQLAAWRASQTGHNPDTYEEQLAALQTQLAGLQARYTDSHPDVIKAKIEIEALKEKIAESEDQNKVGTADQAGKESAEPSQFRPLRAQILAYDRTIAEKTAAQESIQQQIKLYQARVESSPAIEQQYKALTRDYQTAFELYNDLSKKRSQSTMATDLERRQEAEQFRLLDPANLPSGPSYPNRQLFALGGLGGGIAFGLALSYLLEMRDTSLRTERDVEVALQLPVLAMVPPLNSQHDTKSVQSIRQLPIAIGKG